MDRFDESEMWHFIQLTTASVKCCVAVVKSEYVTWLLKIHKCQEIDHQVDWLLNLFFSDIRIYQSQRFKHLIYINRPYLFMGNVEEADLKVARL